MARLYRWSVSRIYGPRARSIIIVANVLVIPIYSVIFSILVDRLQVAWTLRGSFSAAGGVAMALLAIAAWWYSARVGAIVQVILLLPFFALFFARSSFPDWSFFNTRDPDVWKILLLTIIVVVIPTALMAAAVKVILCHRSRSRND